MSVGKACKDICRKILLLSQQKSIQSDVSEDSSLDNSQLPQMKADMRQVPRPYHSEDDDEEEGGKEENKYNAVVETEGEDRGKIALDNPIAYDDAKS